LASAIAMTTRCRIPPLNSCGNARKRSGAMPTCSSSSAARAVAAGASRVSSAASATWRWIE
jgi:hypothetical protein